MVDGFSRALFLWTAIGMASSGLAHAQSTRDLEFFRSVTETIIGNTRRTVLPVLTQREAAIEREIVYFVTNSPDIGAFARRNERRDGRREVVILAGFVGALHSMAQAYIVADGLGIPACLDSWARQYGAGVARNTMLAREGRPPQLVPNIFAYAVSAPATCPGVSQQTYSSLPEVGRVEQGFMDAAIAMIFLHEVGHHVNGDLDTSVGGRDEQRSREAAADAWAVTTAWRANFNMAAAVPFFLLTSVFDAGDLHTESRSTHPLGVRRALEIHRLIRRAVAERGPIRERLEADGDLESFLRDLDETIAGLARSLNAAR